jgi:hypothetical protein
VVSGIGVLSEVVCDLQVIRQRVDGAIAFHARR